MIKSKKQMFTVIGVFTLIMLLGTVTYAFFNYTRTGNANTISTGQINFLTTQSNTLSLTNVFPMASSEVGNANLDEVEIRIQGDTTYSGGEEFEITIEGVNNTIGTSPNEKTIPINFVATYTRTATGDVIGSPAVSDYFSERGSTTAVYSLTSSGVATNGKQVLVGFIPANGEIDGTLKISAYLDASNIAISDTYYENVTTTPTPSAPNDEYGTTEEWVAGRTVLTTTEWNALQNAQVPLSFKIKAVSQEGIWVIDRDRNDMKNISGTTVFTSAQKTSITEINFIKATEEEINTHADLIDLTASGGNGMVKAWIENNKLYIASPGTTYFPEDSSGLFSSSRNNISEYFSNVVSINFYNINTSKVTSMIGMFSGCTSLTELDLSNFDTSNVTNMISMFNGCTSLTELDLSSFNTSNVSMMGSMFNMGSSPGISALTTIYVSNSWNGDNVIDNGGGMFYNCTSLKGGGTPQTTYDGNHFDKEYARIDGGANSSTPGYLTLKTN